MTKDNEEDWMACADFYVQTDDGTEYIGTLLEDGAPTYLDDVDLFGPAENRSFDEATYRRIVNAMLGEYREQGCAASVEAGDPWPWPDRRPDSSETEYVYLYVKGAVQVFRSGTDENGNPGQFLAAVHYPNGARKPTSFPVMVSA